MQISRKASVRVQRNGITDRVTVDIGEELDVSEADSIEIKDVEVHVKE